MSKHSLFASALFLVLASTAANASPRRHHEGRDFTAPLSAQLRVVQVSANWAIVELELEKRVDWSLPLAVSVELPQGVLLQSGEREFSVTLRKEGVSKAAFEVAYANIPAEPIRVVVQARAKGFGLTANLSASLMPQPAQAAAPVAEPTGAPLKMGRFRLGAAVEMADTSSSSSRKVQTQAQ